jgi:hypothetical protein
VAVLQQLLYTMGAFTTLGLFMTCLLGTALWLAAWYCFRRVGMAAAHGACALSAGNTAGSVHAASKLLYLESRTCCYLLLDRNWRRSRTYVHCTTVQHSCTKNSASRLGRQPLE